MFCSNSMVNYGKKRQVHKRQVHCHLFSRKNMTENKVMIFVVKLCAAHNEILWIKVHLKKNYLEKKDAIMSLSELKDIQLIINQTIYSAYSSYLN